MALTSPGPRETLRQIWAAGATAAVLAVLGTTTVGTSATAMLHAEWAPQPFGPVAGMAAGAAEAAAVSTMAAMPDTLRRTDTPPSRSDARPWQTQVLATAGGVALHTPSEHVRVVGFHQSGSGAAVPLEPRGAPFTNRNLPRYTPPPPSEGPDYAVLGHRRRATLPTTAVDLAVPHNTTLLSPVSGTVVEVRPYLLYGRFPDLIATVVPDGRPDLRVVMMHMNGILVARGHHLEAGQTPLARTAMRFPFRSQIDEFAGQGPHLHVEVRRAP